MRTGAPRSRRAARRSGSLRPGLDELDQLGLVVGVERDRPRGAGGLERGDDAAELVSAARLLEEMVARIPREREGLIARGELDVDAVEAFRHGELLAFTAGALAGFDAYYVRDSDELLLPSVDFDPAMLVWPAVATDDGLDRGGIVGVALHLLAPTVDGPDPDGHRMECRP